MEIGKIIMERRRALNLTQEEVANRSGTTRVALSKIERGINIPSWELSERLLKAVNLKIIIKASY